MRHRNIPTRQDEPIRDLPGDAGVEQRSAIQARGLSKLTDVLGKAQECGKFNSTARL
jgi:hypothetical protein